MIDDLRKKMVDANNAGKPLSFYEVFNALGNERIITYLNDTDDLTTKLDPCFHEDLALYENISYDEILTASKEARKELAENKMKESFLEHYFGFKMEEGIDLSHMTREERREVLFGKRRKK